MLHGLAPAYAGGTHDGLAPRSFAEAVTRAAARTEVLSVALAQLFPGGSLNAAQPIPSPSNMYALELKYGASAWVYICLLKQARDLASPPFVVSTANRAGDLDDSERDHPLAKLLKRPNPWTTGRELTEITSIYGNLTGNAFWLLGRDRRGGKPTSIYPINPVATEIHGSAVKIVDHYRLTHFGESIDVPAEDMVHFRYPNPLSDAASAFPNPWGVGPMEAAWNLVVTETDAVTWNRTLMKNDGRPTGVLTSDQEIGPADAQFAAEQYRKIFGGPDKQGKVLTLGKNMRYERIAHTPVEMDYHDTSIRLREEIMAMFGMNPTVLGLLLGDVSGRAEQHREYWNATIMSAAEAYLLPPINEGLATQFGDYVVAQDYSNVKALQENEIERSGYVQRYWQMGVPFNELNDRFDLGFPDAEGGDVGFLSAGVVPVDQLLNPPEPPEMGGGFPGEAPPGLPPKKPVLALTEGEGEGVRTYLASVIAKQRYDAAVRVVTPRRRRPPRLLVGWRR